MREYIQIAHPQRANPPLFSPGIFHRKPVCIHHRTPRLSYFTPVIFLSKSTCGARAPFICFPDCKHVKSLEAGHFQLVLTFSTALSVPSQSHTCTTLICVPSVIWKLLSQFPDIYDLKFLSKTANLLAKNASTSLFQMNWDFSLTALTHQ